MSYFIAAGILAVPIVILVITGKLYYWKFLVLKYLRWSENPVGFLVYLILYASFSVYFLTKGIRMP